MLHTIFMVYVNDPFWTPEPVPWIKDFPWMEGAWFWVLPAYHRWNFACLHGPVPGMPRTSAGPQTKGWGPLVYVIVWKWLLRQTIVYLCALCLGGGQIIHTQSITHINNEQFSGMLLAVCRNCVITKCECHDRNLIVSQKWL